MDPSSEPARAMTKPNPVPLFEALNAYQLTEAVKAALSLRLFTAVAESDGSPAQAALRCRASERGVRILADYLTTHGFLLKAEGRYALEPELAPFLVKTSPVYLGDTVEFLLSADLVDGFRDLANCVRQGGTTVSAHGTMETQHPVWVNLARVMGPVLAVTAPKLAELVDPAADKPIRLLDIAAGHGLFGIAFAQRNLLAQVLAQDWAPVLEVAREHAQRAGVGGRYGLLPGDAFEVDLGTGNDVVLLTNFLHHFDPPTCERLLRRIAASVAPGGVVATLEFIPNEDRVTPPPTARFALTMLATTAAGDAFTFREYEAMFRHAGFSRSTLHALPESPQSVILSAL
jgi:2-polyprenyl-3-methyl-5-hydroxy-6-metoxy-1,4-benzoquinol methylase